ncbi:MAG: hypothetical protein HQK97_01370 [Nitrospirae bacterium]|nr:hypothetical protein [Nitrospirota bacterium]
MYESKLCIYDEFREGNASPAFGQKEFYTACKNRMPRGKQIKAYRADIFIHVIATNWLEEEKTGYEVIQWHNQRGDAENFNKELKGGFGMERMPCGQTYPNAVLFRI